MESIFDYIISRDPFWIYMFLIAGAYIENILPPAPGDTVVVFGAFLVGIGTLNFTLTFFTTTFGSVAGFITMYGLGRYFDVKLVESHKWRFFSSKEFIRIEAWFEKYGYKIIAANRFLSGARAVVSLFAGISRLNFKKVLALAFISCAVWNFILIYSGSKVGENWRQIVAYVKQYNIIVLSILFVIGIFVVIRLQWRKKKVKIN